MSKAVTTTNSFVRLIVPAGKATPAPPLAPALGQRGVKAMDVCKQFNERTKHLVPGIPMRVLLTVKPDRSFTFLIKSPPSSWFLLQAAGVEKGSSRPTHVVAGEVSLKHVYEIAAVKMTDPGNEDISHEAMCSRILAQAKGMGINVTA